MPGRISRALLLATLLFEAVFVALLPTAAKAHNGVGAAFKGRAGPYTVYAYDGYALPSNAVEYRLVLLDAASSEPADDVTVSIMATKPGKPETTAESHAYANVVYYTLPNVYPHAWRVEVSLHGRAGRGKVHFRMHGIQPLDPTPVETALTVGGGTPTALVVGVSAGVVLAAGLAVMWRRRRG